MNLSNSPHLLLYSKYNKINKSQYFTAPTILNGGAVIKF